MSRFETMLRIAGRKEKPYLSAEVPTAIVRPYLRELRAAVGLRTYLKFRWNRFLRDGLSHHVTIVAPFEFHEVEGRGFPSELDFQPIGIGMVHAEPDRAYYVVLESVAGTAIRTALQLPRKDFHVTLGFHREDVHGISKGLETLIRPR
jgi:hypothetical protein